MPPTGNTASTLQAVLVTPADARLHLQLGVHHAESHQMNAALDCFRNAVELDPSLTAAHACLGNWYLTQGMIELALRSSAIAFNQVPNNPQIMLSRARILEAAGQPDLAWNLAGALVDHHILNAGTLRLYGRMARYRDRADFALSLTTKTLATPNLSVSERAGLHFTAADLLDGLQRYDKAFEHAAAGNALIRPMYDAAAHERTFDTFTQYFTAERMRRLARSTEWSNQPVFIVGMPRSGTSLVEQILAAHPSIHGGGELDLMQHVQLGIVAMLGDYPGCLDHLTAEQATGMGQIYLGPLNAISPSSPRITDKLPLNVLHLGLINLLLPGARVIHCRRNAMDTCLSCHMNHFAEGNEFKFDLQNLGRFHRQYQRLMAHWSTVLDLRMIDIDYEQIVADPEVETRRLLQFLDLPYDNACLNFHTSTRPVITSSLQQVRQPLYRTAVQRWKHYEKHLGPLQAALST